MLPHSPLSKKGRYYRSCDNLVAQVSRLRHDKTIETPFFSSSHFHLSLNNQNASTPPSPFAHSQKAETQVPMHSKKKSAVQLSRTTTTTTTTTTSIESISINNLRHPTLVNNRVLHFPRTSLSTNTNNSSLHSVGQGTSNTKSTTNIAAYENARRIPQPVAVHQLKTTLGHLKSVQYQSILFFLSKYAANAKQHAQPN